MKKSSILMTLIVFVAAGSFAWAAVESNGNMSDANGSIASAIEEGEEEESEGSGSKRDATTLEEDEEEESEGSDSK